MRLAAAFVCCLLAAACGPGPDKINKVEAAPPLSGPTYAGVGSLSSATLETVTIDHEAVPEAGLAAGRTTFRAYADVMATAPEAPGSRVALSFRKQGKDWALTELTARP
ncbi:MAG TPA: copper-binding protein [Caulobacter sp.]|nr:copper-binding protein [Caulobacter sp.]